MFDWGTIWKQNVWLRHIVRDEPRIAGCFRSSVMISPLFVAKRCTTPWVAPLNQQPHWGFSCSFLMFVVAFLSSSLLNHSNLSSGLVLSDVVVETSAVSQGLPSDVSPKVRPAEHWTLSVSCCFCYFYFFCQPCQRPCYSEASCFGSFSYSVSATAPSV